MKFGIGVLLLLGLLVAAVLMQRNLRSKALEERHRARSAAELEDGWSRVVVGAPSGAPLPGSSLSGNVWTVTAAASPFSSTRYSVSRVLTHASQAGASLPLKRGGWPSWLREISPSAVTATQTSFCGASASAAPG